MTFVKQPTEINGYKVVQDYDEILDAIKNGETIAHWERGNSMRPIMSDCEYCIIKPIHKIDVKTGDAVFCKVNGFLMVHMVWQVSRCGKDGKLYFMIGSTSGEIYGWTNEVYGIAYGTEIFEDINE